MEDIGAWVVEWCSLGEQYGIFHVDTLAGALRGNFQTYMEREQRPRKSAWIILGIFDTNEEAHQFLNQLQSDA